jgi:predicted RNase H-like HicB family nuclease
MGGGRTRGWWGWQKCSIWSKWGGYEAEHSYISRQDGVFIAECPSIPGCVSQGASEAEAQANVMNAIRECLAVRAVMGRL